jgi:hypothetical protein
MKVAAFNQRINEYTTAFSPVGGGPADFGQPGGFGPGGFPPPGFGPPGKGGPPAPPPPSGQGYVVGKIITVQMSPKREVDWIYFDLPGELKARKPEEVGTVVQLSWSEQEIDKYDDGAGAFVHLCDVKVVDLAKKQVVATRSFRGGDPPQSKSSAGSAYGSKPTQDIVNFLKGLPRQG